MQCGDIRKGCEMESTNISLFLYNKLGGNSDDLWLSGSICSQLDKKTLRNIKEIFADLQTQIKLKFLLSFFHIPRRLIEEVTNCLQIAFIILDLSKHVLVYFCVSTQDWSKCVGFFTK